VAVSIEAVNFLPATDVFVTPVAVIWLLEQLNSKLLVAVGQVVVDPSMLAA
jgi:hypothetical protein